MENGDYSYRDAYKKMMLAKEHHRPIEHIVDAIKQELMVVKEESLLIHAMLLILELNQRKTSPLYAHLQSPMRQALYLIDVYYSIEKRKEVVDMDEERWDRIAILLDEIEMTYFVNIAFPNDGDLYHDERDKKIEVSLPTFLNYFSNASFSYEEQTLYRIVRDFKPYDGYIQAYYGFTIDEVLKFIFHTRKLNNDKLNDMLQSYVFYMSHPEEWRKLTQKFIERGIDDPYEWHNQPELSWLKRIMTTNPGEIHMHEKKELMDVDIDPDILQHILDFFSYDKDLLKGKTIYYADKYQSESHPLIQIGEKYICPINKFLLEGLYFRIDEALMQEEPKYKQAKDVAFEKKVVDVFRQFFPEKTKIFTNYSVDGIAENDLLVVYGKTCIIVEIKDCNFRAPFRDPIKAYDRIKRDFKNAIQLGYEQCRRVETILLSGKDVEICDADNPKKVLYNLRNRNIEEVWSIIVTNFNYGAIQTDLSQLLEKDEEALYPWAVWIDNLEAMFLLMKKMLKGIAPARFIEFLDYRERLQERIMCFDELEICGWYLNDREQFKECSDKDTIIATTPDMGTIFDAYYHVGLGFPNELDMEYKKNYKLSDYPCSFELSEITGEMVRGEI